MKQCPQCGATLSVGMQYCSVCGTTVAADQAPAGVAGTAEVSGEVPGRFTGGALAILGWIVLSALSTFLVIPLAWVMAAFARWFCHHTDFGDGTKLEFRGTGGQIVIWPILYMLVVGMQIFLLGELQDSASPTARLGGAIAIYLGAIVALVAIALTLIKWLVFNLKLVNAQLGDGPDLTFEGSYGGLLGWYLLLLVSVYTIVGWAWVSVGLYRWMTSKIKGRGVVFSFHATGVQILWRTLAAALGCVLILPIPWVYRWLTAWLVENIHLTRREEFDLSSFG